MEVNLPLRLFSRLVASRISRDCTDVLEMRYKMSHFVGQLLQLSVPASA